MNTPRDEYLDLCAGYVLGGLSHEERTRLEARLDAGDLLCEAALYEMSAGTLLLAATAPALTPPPELRSRVLEGIDAAGRPERAMPASEGLPGEAPASTASRRDPIAEARVNGEASRRSSGALWGALVTAFALILAVVGWGTVRSLQNDLALARARANDLESEMAGVRSSLGTAETLFAEGRRKAEVIGARDVLVISMDPSTEEITQVSGRAFFAPRSGLALVHVHDVPPLPDSDHELWAIGETGPASMGLLHPDDGGHAEVLVSLGDTSGVSAIAVSREPPGGSPDPTGPSGPLVLIGHIRD